MKEANSLWSCPSLNSLLNGNREKEMDLHTENHMDKEKGFIGYEYKEVTGSAGMIPLLMDGYESFGWEVTEQTKVKQEQQSAAGRLPAREKINLRRDRHIMNKVELTRLQRNFEACVDEIGRLEQAKTTRATYIAIAIGVFGAALLAGAVFAFLADPPLIWLMVILAIPGFACWILPVSQYKKFVARDTKRINPLIEDKYEEIYDLCEKGHKLLPRNSESNN